MINKTQGVYVQSLLSKDTKNLLENFSKRTGYSQSFIIRTIVEVNLPLEVDRFMKKMEVAENEKTKTF